MKEIASRYISYKVEKVVVSAQKSSYSEKNKHSGAYVFVLDKVPYYAHYYKIYRAVHRVDGKQYCLYYLIFSYIDKNNLI